MAPTCPEEIDVFSVPHSRMKELVNKYLDRVITLETAILFYLAVVMGNRRLYMLKHWSICSDLFSQCRKNVNNHLLYFKAYFNLLIF